MEAIVTRWGWTMQKDDSPANSNLNSPLNEILKRLGRMQNDAVNKVSGQAGYTVEEKFADAVPGKMALQYVRGKDLVQSGLADRKLAPADLKAIEVYRRIHNELPAKLPFYNKETLSRDIDILVSGKARAVQIADQNNKMAQREREMAQREPQQKENLQNRQGQKNPLDGKPVEKPIKADAEKSVPARPGSGSKIDTRITTKLDSKTDSKTETGTKSESKTKIESRTALEPAPRSASGSDKPAPQKAIADRQSVHSPEKPPATASLMQKIGFIREMRRICDAASVAEMHARPRGNLDAPKVMHRLVQRLYSTNIERHPAREQLARHLSDKNIERFQGRYDGLATLRFVARINTKTETRINSKTETRINSKTDTKANAKDKSTADSPTAFKTDSIKQQTRNQDRAHEPVIIVARHKGDYQHPVWRIASPDRLEKSLRAMATKLIPISESRTVKSLTLGTIALQRYIGQPRGESPRLMMTVADLFHHSHADKKATAVPNARQMPIYKSAMSLRVFEPIARAEPSVAKTQAFVAHTDRRKSDRYIGSADVTFVLVFALAVAAKNRLDDGDTKTNLDVYQRLELQYRQSDGQAVRPAFCVRNGDTIDGIARELFNNASVAHLIADINMAAIQEEYHEGKRIIRLKERQQLRLPLLEDINAYFAGKYHKIADKAQLVTIVESSQIDDEAVYEHLARILVGAAGSDKRAVQAAQQSRPSETSANKDKEWFDSPATYRKALIKKDLISTVAEDDNHFEIQDGDRIVDHKYKQKGNRD